jgi:glycosyltransferase involved in cell wall biosynthesis
VSSATGHAVPLEVIVVNDFASVTGGGDRVALEEAVELARRGHAVTLVAGHGEPDPSLAEAGVTVRMTGQPPTIADSRPLRAAARGIWNRQAAALMSEVAAAANPRHALVHIHGFVKVLSASAVAAAVHSGLPTVATLHDYFAVCPNGGLFNYQRNHACSLTPLSLACITTHCDARSYSHKLWRVGRSAVQSRFGAMPAGVGAVIVPSRRAAEIMRPLLPAAMRMHVLPSPIDAQRRPPTRVAANDAFVFVGRLDRDKGPALFAAAAAKAGVRAVFVGTGAEVAAILAACPQAELTGWLAADAVQAALRGARAIVNSSLSRETQGLSVLEAAAHGVPAIVSDATVLTEIVADGRTGLWFRGAEVDDLARCLELLAGDPELAARLGEAAYRRFWAGSWNLSSHVDRLERVYQDTAAQAGALAQPVVGA